MQGLLAQSSDMSAWTSGAAVLTFVFPMLLFIAVAGALYVLYTKPETVPGRQIGPPALPVTYTAVPGPPRAVPEPARAQVTSTEGDAAAETGTGEAARTEDAE